MTVEEIERIVRLTLAAAEILTTPERIQSFAKAVQADADDLRFP